MISVVISMYNSNKQVLEAIENLLFPSLIQNGGADKELILIDDASPLQKETEELVNRFKPALTKAFQSVTIHQNEHNLGFGRSYNLGISLAYGAHILIANSDVYFSKDSISNLVETLTSNSKYGLVAPVTNYAAGFQNTHPFKHLVSYAPEELNRIEAFATWLRQAMAGKYVDTDSIIGFCWAIRADLFREMGGFDSLFGLSGGEDFDLIRKIRQHYQTIIDCSVFVEHGGKGVAGHTLSVRGSLKAVFSYYILAPIRYSRKWHDWKSFYKFFFYLPIVQYLLDKDTVTDLILKEAKKKDLLLHKIPHVR